MRATQLLAALQLVCACRSAEPAPYRPEAPPENLLELVSAYSDAAGVSLTFRRETGELLASMRIRPIPAGEQELFLLEPPELARVPSER